MTTSRQIISDATRHYRQGVIGDDAFLAIVGPVTVAGGAPALLRMLQRERRPQRDADVIDTDYRVIEPENLPESVT